MIAFGDAAPYISNLEDTAKAHAPPDTKLLRIVMLPHESHTVPELIHARGDEHECHGVALWTLTPSRFL